MVRDRNDNLMPIPKQSIVYHKDKLTRHLYSLVWDHALVKFNEGLKHS